MAIRELWFHFLGAKAGGGITYFHSVVPELIRVLEGRGIRLVLLVPGPMGLGSTRPWVEVREMPFVARGHLSRFLFDQIGLPLHLVGREAALFCSGSFAPVLGTVPTVVLLRNTIYFDPVFLQRETFARRLSLRLQETIIAAGGRASHAIHYPTKSMQELVEGRHPGLRGRGIVNSYGVGAQFRGSNERSGEPRSDTSPRTFLYVMNYTLQKNLGFILEALCLAKREGLSVRVAVTSALEQGPRPCFAKDRSIIERHDLIRSNYLLPLGPRHGDALLATYRDADALLFPSITEAFGHPLVEAMGLGLPIVAADRPYAREICGPHATYVDPTCPEALVEVWRKWPEILHRMRPVDPDSFRTRFSWRTHVERLLESLLGGESGSGHLRAQQ